MSDLLDWNTINIPNPFDYIRDLLIDYQYILPSQELTSLYLYTKLDDKIDESNSVIYANIKPVGWGVIFKNQNVIKY